MNDYSAKSREGQRAKIAHYTRKSDGQVDASGYEVPGMIDAEEKTGPGTMPNTVEARKTPQPRAFKRGGAVHGDGVKHHAGRKARAAGGPMPMPVPAQQAPPQQASNMAQPGQIAPPMPPTNRFNFSPTSPGMMAIGAGLATGGRAARKDGGGNWIEGEARFNRTDINIHGMDAQVEYLVRNYPQRKGLVTYAVTGDDHEGWYAQREGIDIGRHVANQMRNAGREDWVNLGYMESHIKLVNANTGKHAIMAVVHPGGGSSYADSYVVQKIIESLEGGEKPAVALYGHYHKCLAGEYRNVWWVLVPSTKDQDVFMRKKRIRSVVGGGIITLEQDPKTGAITGMTPKLWRYFNKSYYNDRWSPSGPVTLPKREPFP